jgi:hypothetical protein
MVLERGTYGKMKLVTGGLIEKTAVGPHGKASSLML